ncbi:MAG: c-type cytochrome [Planctomycetota bacterium]|nr:c-type cytochrome [Planctomycetota bacterium]MDA1214378.1 c-type cytochrome [Planctomycetota bacterium]
MSFSTRSFINVVTACFVIAMACRTKTSFAQGEKPFPAEEAARTITLPEGFHATVVAEEPDVVQPIAFTFDGKGRLWVVEGMTYPSWMDGGTLHDRIIILEDKDGDGHAETRTVFYDEGMNFTGIELGFGGVWICATPHLLFIPDRNRDDIPDGPPEVVLDGWDEKARHNMFNALRWGPDGWLYGCNGILSNSKVGRPDAQDDDRVELNCGVWRYHPSKQIVEAVAHGTTNPWGLDFDEYGQMFITNCVIKHLFHVVPGAHYDRMFGQGVNSHVYSLIESCADHRHWGEGHWTDSRGGIGEHDGPGGGHAHAGCMVYLGDNWPAEYRNTLFTCNIHGQRLNNDILERDGSGYVAHHGKDFLKFADPWYRGLEMKYGPDGSVYLTDWSDIGECHDYDGHIARDNGRIYKITYGEPTPAKTNVSSLIDSELVELQWHTNEWFVRQARHELQQRAVTRTLRRDVYEALHAKLTSEVPLPQRLRALWALHVTHGCTQEKLAELLDDESEHIRYWAVVLELEDHDASPKTIEKLYQMAESDPSPLVRLALASGMQRLGDDQRRELVRRLSTHEEDIDDHNLPLMLWYGVEPMVMSDIDGAMNLMHSSQIPLLRKHIARRMTIDTLSATAENDSHETPLNRLVKFLASENNPDVQRDALLGIAEALEGRRDVPIPASWSTLVKSIDAGSSDVAKESALTLSVTFGDPRALKILRTRVADESLDTETRSRALKTLVRKHDRETSLLMQKLLKQSNSAKRGTLRSELLRGLAVYDDAAIPTIILKGYSSYSDAERQDAINTLAVRPEWSRMLLQAVENKTIPPRDISTVTARQIYELKDAEIQKLLSEVWGDLRDTSKEKQELIAQYKSQLTPDVVMQADRSNGRAVFTKTCAGCHKLFDTGRAVGPELTGAQRNNIDYLLTNLLDPSANVSRSYLLNIIVTTDGRVLNGVVQQESPNTITLLTANDTIIVSTADIDERVQAQVSMMPEGMLGKLSEIEVRDLIGYLAGAEQVPLPDETGK